MNNSACKDYHAQILEILNSNYSAPEIIREIFSEEVIKCDESVDLNSLRTEIYRDISGDNTYTRVINFEENSRDIHICNYILSAYKKEIKNKLKPWWKLW